MRRLLGRTSLAATLVLAACSSSDSPSGAGQPTAPIPNTNAASTMSAVVDGAPWTAVAVSVTSVPAGPFGTLTLISGIDDQSGIGFYVRAGQLGAQSLGTVSATENIALFLVLLGGGTGQPPSWVTDASNKGVLTLTLSTSTRLAGTFYFDARASTATLTPQIRKITNGAFDVRF